MVIPIWDYKRTKASFMGDGFFVKGDRFVGKPENGIVMYKDIHGRNFYLVTAGDRFTVDGIKHGSLRAYP